MRCLTLFLGATLAIAAAVSCGASQETSGQGGSAATGNGGSTGVGGTTGLPCDVSQVLKDHCLTCHGDPTAQNAPESLDTYDELVAPSFANKKQTFAERAVVRMQDKSLPMPPAPATSVSAAEVTVLQNWIAAGYPMGSCNGMPTTCMSAADCNPGQLCQGSMCIDPLNAAPGCTSNQYSFDREGYNMAPGGACNACHMMRGEGRDHPPYFAFAGTVFPTGHEPDDCAATPAVESAVVIIVDANGNQALTLTPNAVGNFYSSNAVAMPYTAKVVYQGRERVMASPQTSGDCNSCHTQDGTNPGDAAAPAPGRITLP